MTKLFKKISFINSIQDFLNINYGVSRLITFVISFFILTHIVGCLWYLIPMLYDENENWVIYKGILNETSLRKYINSIYWAMTTVTTCGFGDISAKNDIEYVISLIWVLFGVFFYSFTIGTLSTILVNMNTKTNLMSKKLNIINHYSKENKLDKDLCNEIKRKLIYNSNGNLFSWIEKQEIFENLPANLKCSIAISMREGYLKDVHFFQRKDDGFISMIVPNLHSIFYHSSEYIYKKKETPTFIYFIINGRVSFLTCFNVIFRIYVKGSYFGAYEIIRRLKYRVNSIISCTSSMVEVLGLSKTVYEKIVFKEYPQIHKEMKILSKLRLKRLVDDEARICKRCNKQTKKNKDGSGSGSKEENDESIIDDDNCILKGLKKVSRININEEEIYFNSFNNNDHTSSQKYSNINKDATKVISQKNNSSYNQNNQCENNIQRESQVSYTLKLITKNFESLSKAEEDNDSQSNKNLNQIMKVITYQKKKKKSLQEKVTKSKIFFQKIGKNEKKKEDKKKIIDKKNEIKKDVRKKSFAYEKIEEEMMKLINEQKNLVHHINSILINFNNKNDNDFG